MVLKFDHQTEVDTLDPQARVFKLEGGAISEVARVERAAIHRSVDDVPDQADIVPVDQRVTGRQRNVLSQLVTNLEVGFRYERELVSFVFTLVAHRQQSTRRHVDRRGWSLVGANARDANSLIHIPQVNFGERASRPTTMRQHHLKADLTTVETILGFEQVQVLSDACGRISYRYAADSERVIDFKV